MRTPPIHVGSRIYHLWPRGSASADSEIQDAVESVQIAVTLFDERVNAELPKDDLRMSFDIFDLGSQWMDASSWSPSQRNAFVKKARTWFRSLKFSPEDCDRGIQEFEDAA